MSKILNVQQLRKTYQSGGSELTVLEDISFEAPEKKNGELVIDKHYVRDKLSEIVKDEDLSRYIL